MSGYIFQATVTNVVDGDTFDAKVHLAEWRFSKLSKWMPGAIVDLGFHVGVEVVPVGKGDAVAFRVFLNERFRLRGLNAPEKKGDTKLAGIAAEKRLEQLILGKQIELRSSKAPDQEKYGRWLAHVFDGQIDINKTLVDEGYAVPYMVEG